MPSEDSNVVLFPMCKTYHLKQVVSVVWVDVRLFTKDLQERHVVLMRPF